VRISELASRADVKVSTVRFYERSGALPPPRREAGGYRDFNDEDLRLLRFLRRGQQLGFTLRELSDFVELSGEARRGVVSAGEVSAAAAEKLAEIDERIADLQRTRSAITALLSDSTIDPSAPCPIVAALADERRPVV
jgi:MerR family mercuric resistance operon transcriptional regulator